MRIQEEKTDLQEKSTLKNLCEGHHFFGLHNASQEQYVTCPIDKAVNNIAFIYKKYYVQVLLK